MSESNRKSLSALDATLLVMGGIIGIGIFFNPADIATRAFEPWAFLLVWVLGGLIALCAAFTFAELGASFPRTGGWFVYLREAFGPLPAFLFAWVTLGVITTGAIAAVSLFCAQQLQGLLPGLDQWLQGTNPFESGPAGEPQAGLPAAKWASNLIASGVALGMTGVALSGVKRAALLQNLCMFIKLAAIGALVIFGLFLVNPPSPAPLAEALTEPLLQEVEQRSIVRGMLAALLPVFFAFGGWQMVSYIAPQVRDPKRTLPRAIILGVLGVIVVYVSVNFAYMSALGIEGLAGNPGFAADIATGALGESGGQWLSAGIVASAMGWVMVTTITAPWLYVAMAEAGVFLRSLGRLSQKNRVPAMALCLQAVISLGYIWYGSIEFLVDAVVSVEWIFHGLVALALIRIRRRHSELARPFKSPLYPLAPVVYALAAGTVVISTCLTENWQNKLWLSAGLLLAGSLTFTLWTRSQRGSAS